jgi:hypothetical protein
VSTADIFRHEDDDELHPVVILSLLTRFYRLHIPSAVELEIPGV